MAKKTPEKIDRDAVLAEVAKKLPASKRARLQAAVDALRIFDESVRIENVTGVQMMGDIYSAVVWLLNGRTMHGAGATGAAGDQVRAACAAVPGAVPGWGQAGDFLLEVGGMRLRVDVAPWSVGGDSMINVNLHAVDLAELFVSETGYRNVMLRAGDHYGKTFVQALSAQVIGLLKEKGGRRKIVAERQQALADRVPDWLKSLPSVDGAPCYGPDGQMIIGFALEAEPSAPKSTADRQREFRKRRAAAIAAGELVVLEMSREEAEFVDGAIGGYIASARRPEVSEAFDSIWRRLLIARGVGHYTPADEKWSREAVRNAMEQSRDRLAAYCAGQSLELEQALAKLEKLNADNQRLRREMQLLEQERCGAFAAIKVFEERLRVAGLSTDYRK